MKLYGRNINQVTFRGEVYDPDENGVFEVPEDATELLSHGLTRELPAAAIAPAKPVKAAEPPKPAAKSTETKPAKP